MTFSPKFSLSDFPISTTHLQLLGALPHRPPMVWIDSVITADENQGTCKVILKRDGLPCSLSGLRQSSVVEWLAQASGYVIATAALSSPASSLAPTNRAYLVAVNRLDYGDESVWSQFQQKLAQFETLELLIKIQVIRRLGPLSLISGEVFYEDLKLANGMIKIYSD